MVIFKGKHFFALGKQLAYFHIPTLTNFYEKHGVNEEFQEFVFRYRKFKVFDLKLDENTFVLFLFSTNSSADENDIFSLLRFKKTFDAQFKGEDWKKDLIKDFEIIEKKTMGKSQLPNFFTFHDTTEHIVLWHDNNESIIPLNDEAKKIFEGQDLHSLRKLLGLPLEKLKFLKTVLPLKKYEKTYISATHNTFALNSENHSLQGLLFSILDKESLLLLDALPFSAAITNQKFRILWVNRLWHGLFEKPIGDLHHIVHESDIHHLQNLTHPFLSPIRYNPTKWVKWHVKPYHNKRFLVLASDESQNMFERETQKSMLEKLEASNKVLERFAHICAHDLKEPLRTISNYAHLLIQKPEKQQDYTEIIVKKCAYMRDLIDNTLRYSLCQHAQEGFQWVNIKDIVKTALLNLDSKIIETEAQINWHLANPVHMFCHKTQITQVIQNVIDNAIKFTKKRPAISIQHKSYPEYHQITVSDNGIGIDEEYLDKIFNLYTRLNSQNDYPGSGIGLSLCKKIMEYHKGQILIDSRVNNGTTVTLRLPF